MTTLPTARLLVPLTALVALAGCGGAETSTAGKQPAAATIPAPAGQSWADTVTQTPEGGHLMGNPNAPVKLVEFGSLTCHICAEFDKEGSEPLKGYVNSGTVSWEFRPFIRNSLDLVASRLADCVPAQAFFPIVDSLYADQSAWAFDREAQINAAIQANASQPPTRLVGALGTASGLDERFAARGLSTAAQTQCLGDANALTALADRTQSAGQEYDIQGTPTFLLNGRKVEGTAWSLIEQQLIGAGARKS